MSAGIHLENLPRTVEMSSDEEGFSFTYIDQRLLPLTLKRLDTKDWVQVVDAVKTLAVRGAPAIGIAGAAALALWAQSACDTYREADDYRAGLDAAASTISSARPTAVNLSWAVDNAAGEARRACSEGASFAEIASRLHVYAVQMIEDDEQTNRAIGENGAALLSDGSRILTHCNAGSLATGFYGTALGVVYSAASQGKVERVFADETRPVGQGARLTVWELAQAGVPVTLICDNMAASLMATEGVDAVIVGADRIARNGDTANKIGTYGLAVLAAAHNVPFYVAAPLSTIDFSLADGKGIVIEHRNASEVLSEPIEGVDVWNPAFDVTPAELVKGIITEKGVFSPHELTEIPLTSR